MSIYDDMQAVASGVLAEFKQGVVQYVVDTVADGEAPDESADPVPGTPVTINASVRPVSTRYVDGTNILQSDKQVTFAGDALDPEPTNSGVVLIDGVRHQIIELMRRPAAGTPVSFTLIVRN